MLISRHRNNRRDKGQAAVEFALVIVLLMVLVLSMIELILLMHTYNTVADAAKEGVRYAIVHGSQNSQAILPPCPCTDIDGPAAPPGTVPGYGSGYGVVRTFVQYSLHDTTGITASCSSPAGGSVCVTYPDNVPAANANQSPNRVKVVVSYPFHPLFSMGWPTVTVFSAAEGRIIN